LNFLLLLKLKNLFFQIKFRIVKLRNLLIFQSLQFLMVLFNVVYKSFMLTIKLYFHILMLLLNLFNKLLMLRFHFSLLLKLVTNYLIFIIDSFASIKKLLFHWLLKLLDLTHDIFTKPFAIDLLIQFWHESIKHHKVISYFWDTIFNCSYLQILSL
jgi:hypothetical protein